MSRKLEKGKDQFIVTLLISQDCFSQDYYLYYPYSWFSLPYFEMQNRHCFSETKAQFILKKKEKNTKINLISSTSAVIGNGYIKTHLISKHYVVLPCAGSKDINVALGSSLTREKGKETCNGNAQDWADEREG